MTRVAVVGAGLAGLRAAMEAARLGAEPFVFDSAKCLASLRSSWPSILSGGKATCPVPWAELTRRGVHINLGQAVGQVGRRTLSSNGISQEFDSVVVATGSAAVPDPVPSTGRRGVHVLEGESSFVALKERLDEYAAVVVRGSGLAAASVAERLIDGGTKVTLLASSGFLAQVDARPRRAILKAAEAQGLVILESGIDRVAGVGRVEAVISSGTVVPCDAVIAVPPTEPVLPRGEFLRGENGGVLVDQSAASTLDGVYAAGDCTEVSVCNGTVPIVFESSASAMGRVAGANAAGANVWKRIAGVYSALLFGTEFGMAGLSRSQASACGFNVKEFSTELGDGRECSVVYEAGSLSILGVQLVGAGAMRGAELMASAISLGAGLRDVAFLESFGSTDISPVAETGTEALTRNESCEGSSVRPRRVGASLARPRLSGR